MCADMIDLKKARIRIKELEDHMCADMIDLKKARTRIKELEEEPQVISPEDYIIIDGTNSEPDSSDDDYVDEAGADIMESATEEYF